MRQLRLDYRLLLGRLLPDLNLFLGQLTHVPDRFRGWGFGSSCVVSLVITQINTPEDDSHNEVHLIT